MKKKSKIDFTTDFDALLAEAVKRWEKLEKLTGKTKYSADKADIAKVSKARDAYCKWTHKNFTSKGLTLWTDNFTGKPKSITVTLASI